MKKIVLHTLLLSIAFFSPLFSWELRLADSAEVNGGRLCLRDLGSVSGVSKEMEKLWQSKCNVPVKSDQESLSVQDVEILLLRESLWPDKIYGSRVQLNRVVTESREVKKQTLSRGQELHVVLAKKGLEIEMPAQVVGERDGAWLVRLKHNSRIYHARAKDGIYYLEER